MNRGDTVQSQSVIRVLHVDDDPDLSELTATFLGREDDRFEVETAPDAGEGFERIRDTDFDCIISDYDMPGQNGIEFLRTVREKYPSLPFILYTGKGSEEVASEAITAGVTDYLQKEGSSEQYTILANRILNAVAQTRAEEEVAYTREYFGAMLEHASDYVMVVDDHGEIDYISPAVERVMGYSPDALMDENAFEHVHPEDLEKASEAFSDVLEQPDQSHTLEYRGRHADGSWRWIEVRGRNCLDDSIIEGILVSVRDISERKSHEQELQEKKRRFEAVFTDPNILFALVDTEGKLIDINQSAVGYTDVVPDDVAGTPLWETPWFHDGSELEDEVEDWIGRARNGEYVDFEVDLERNSGEQYTLEGVVRPVPNEEGEVVSLLVSGRDTTDRNEREAELQEERARLTALFENSIDATVFAEYVDGEPIVRDVNPAFEETFGYDEETAIGRSIDDLVLPDDSATREEATELNRRISAGERVVDEVRRQTPEGIRDFLLQSTPVEPGESGTQTYAVYRDISDVKDREAALRRSEERYRTLLETAPTPIFIYSNDAELTYVNEAGVEFLGAADREDLLGSRPGAFTHADSQRNVERRRRRLFEDREAVPPTEETLLDTNGAQRHAIIASSPVTYEGEPAIQTVATDITDLKEHEERLKRYERLVEVAGDPMYMLDEDGHFTYVNEAIAEITGYSKETLVGESALVVMEAEHVERGTEVIRSLLAGDDRQATFEMEFITAEGERIPTENHITVLYDDGEFSGSVGVLRDIRDRLERERQLQRERDRLDEFAAVVSHDLRNPLNVAMGSLELAMEDGDSEHLETVDRAHRRMDQLLEDVLTLARAGEAIGDPAAVDLQATLATCWQNVDTGAADLSIETGAVVRADDSRLQQLLENLLRNAVEHGGEAVRITVGDLPTGFYVEDDGPGIPSEDRDAVLDPGYSTSDEGTGFGLSIVRDIADAHGWTIRVTESESGGARFEICGVECAT